MTSPPPGWVVVIPVKSLAGAKTRLQHPQRADLALAMALDTIEAVASCPLVERVLVVTDDDAVSAAVPPSLARAVTDSGGGDLNVCLLSVVAQTPTAGPLAVLVADLPSARSRDVTRLLAAASAHPICAVADRAGTGTTALLTTTAQALRPAFGVDSFARHLADGAVDLSDQASPGLRLDVDTVADLLLAVEQGVGPATATIIGDGSSLRP